MEKTDKGQTEAIQWTKKTRDKHRPYNGKKDKGQTEATQCAKKTTDKHRPYNGQKRQRTNTGHTTDKKDKG
jgi:hypothetical protein